MAEPRFTDRELDVMDVLWSRGSATVAEVLEEIEDDLAYTTILTVLQTLEEKGHVRHEQEGRAYRYFPEVDREEAGSSAVAYLLRKIFRGSPRLLVSHLVSERDLSEQEMRELRSLLDERLASGDPGGEDDGAGGR